MFVMRKLDRELPRWFRLHWQVRDIWFTEREARIFTWRGAHVTDGANARARSHHHLAREELLPVTSNARIVIGKISNIGKVAFCIPRRGNFVTLIAVKTLMLVR